VAANTRLDSLSDLIRHNANLRATCRTCDRVSIINAQRFARYCLLRCWSSQLEALATRLVCSRCGARGSHVRATRQRAGPDPFPTNEHGWKLLYRRLRD
jgi:hypothetical protein